MQRYRGGLVFKAHELCVSLSSRLERHKEEKEKVYGLEFRGWSYGYTRVLNDRLPPPISVTCFRVQFEGLIERVGSEGQA